MKTHHHLTPVSSCLYYHCSTVAWAHQYLEGSFMVDVPCTNYK